MVPRLIFYHVWSFHLMIFSLIFFRTYSKQRRPPPNRCSCLSEWPFFITWKWKNARDAWNIFFTRGIAWKALYCDRGCVKTEKSVHDCAKLEKNDKFAWFACAWIKRSLLAWLDTPPPSWGTSTTLQTNNYIVFYVCGLCFIKSCFLLGKSEQKNL